MHRSLSTLGILRGNVRLVGRRCCIRLLVVKELFMIDQNALTRMWRHNTDGPPVHGDVLPYDDELYQFRGHAWVEVCKLKQPDLDDENALLWEVGDTYVLADAANLIATIVEIARCDQRFSLEEMVQQVYRLMRESGWVNMRGAKNGQVVVVDQDNDKADMFSVNNVGQVMDALRSGDPVITLENSDGGVTFLNPSKWRTVTCTVSSVSDEEITKHVVGDFREPGK